MSPKCISGLMVSLFITGLSLPVTAQGQQSGKNNMPPVSVDMRPFADNAHHWYDIADKHNIINPLPDRPKYASTELRAIGDNILLFQKNNGGWPKNYDVTAILTESQKESLKKAKAMPEATFDNGTTYTQIQALAVIYSATKEKKYKVAMLKGLDFICNAQYNNGGWPQYFPLENNYSRHITYNDDAFLGIMTLLYKIHTNDSLYGFISSKTKKRSELAYKKGLSCIVNTQIDDGAGLTAWCQQHDEVTLKPAWARKFEPPGICNKESASLVLFLMQIEHPDDSVRQAITHAVHWFEQSKIYNTKVVTFKAHDTTTAFRVSHTDRRIVTDSTAAPIWARYYELGTHRPMFCDRDSKIVYSLAEVSRERRDGYAWYTYEPQKVLDKYPQWLQENSGNLK